MPRDERGAATLPHDLEAEQALLASVLIERDPASAIRVLRRARRYFYSPRTAAIADAILTLDDADQPPDLILIRAELERTGQLEKIGGPAYLVESFAGQARGANVAAYGRRIAAVGWRRAVAQRASGLLDAAGNGVTDRDLAELVETIAEMDRPGESMPHETVAEILARPRPEAHQLVEGLWGEREITWLAGDGGIGKTWVGLHIVACLASGRPVFGRYPVTRPLQVGILDLERSPVSLDDRLHMVCAGLDIESTMRIQVIRRRLVLDDPQDAPRLADHVRETGVEWLLVDSLQAGMEGDDCSAQDIQRVFRTCLYPVRDAGCTVQVIDHLRKMRGDRTLDAVSEALHGSKRKRNAVDSLIGLARRQEALAWQPDKSNHREIPEAGRLRVVFQDGRVTVEWAGSLDAASDEIQDAIAALLADTQLPRGDVVGRLSQFSATGIDRAWASMRRRGIGDSIRVGKQSVWFLTQTNDKRDERPK